MQAVRRAISALPVTTSDAFLHGAYEQAHEAWDRRLRYATKAI
jgi:hypothetical protein